MRKLPVPALPDDPKLPPAWLSWYYWRELCIGVGFVLLIVVVLPLMGLSLLWSLFTAPPIQGAFLVGFLVWLIASNTPRS